MKFLKHRFAKAPEGTAALFFIQIFATLGFAVLYSTLVLYATKHLHLGVKEATALMGVFGAFNYGLHLFGGYLGGRFLSNRNLFVGGMALQVFGCACIATSTLALFYFGLALFLTGSGLNVTCINMMLTQRFTPEDPRREGAFLWNYAGMNVGFFVGFSAAGYFQATESYSSLFIFATLGNFVAIILAALTWKTLADRNTTLLDATPKQFRLRQLAGIGILIGLVPVVWFMLQRPGGTETLIKAICGAVALTLIYLTIHHQDRRERRNMTAYLILTIGSLMFWSLYQMAPSGLMLF
ncbi:MAG: MFS transporter, partial [Verrucomicrobia bacterium]